MHEGEWAKTSCLSEKVGRWGARGDLWVSLPLERRGCLDLETIDAHRSVMIRGPTKQAISPDGSERPRRVNQAPHQGG